MVRYIYRHMVIIIGDIRIYYLVVFWYDFNPLDLFA